MAYFSDAGAYVSTPVYDRYALQPGTRMAGPVIIEERESTLVAGPGTRVSIDERNNVIVDWRDAPPDG
jgi:N-methylhydantoinase A